MSQIAARLGIQQRVLPRYRLAFFDVLAEAAPCGAALFAGQARPGEGIDEGEHPARAQFFPARNLHLFNGPFYLCWQSGMRKWMETWQPEVLIMETNPRTLSNSLAVRWMHARNRPVIGWGLGAPASGGWRAAFRRRQLARFDALIAYSEQGAAQFRALGFDPQGIFVAPNAVTPRPSHAPPERKAGFETPIVLFVGRLQERKRVDLLLQACTRLPQNLQPQLWVVGDGPVRSELEHLSAELYPRTRFFGSLHGAELEPFFCQADLFVLPGTGGLALQQAMSYALPVIAAEADGTQNDLVRSENGWRVSPGSLDSLASALQEALQDAARLRRMGMASYRIVSEEVNIEKMVQAFAIAGVHVVRW